MQPADPWTLGETARLDITIKALGGDSAALTDPAVIILLIKPPSAAQYQVAGEDIKRQSIGYYQAELLLDRPGTWYYRWETGAPVNSAAEGALTVLPSRFHTP